MCADPAGREENACQRTQEHKHWWYRLRDSLDVKSAAELVLAAILVIVTICQAHLITDSNRIAGDTAKKQLRAYASVVKAQVLGLTDNIQLTVRVWVKNSGQTPAHSLTVKMDTWWQGKEAVAGAMPAKEGIETTLASTEEVYIDHRVKDPRKQDLKNGKVSLHAAGTVTYKDVFGIKHESTFHFVQGSEYNPTSPLMGVADGGNTMD